MLRRVTVLAALAIALHGCSLGAPSGETTSTFAGGVTTNAPRPPAPPFDVAAPVDRVVELMAGNGRGGAVEDRLLAELEGYVPGSGAHLASLDTGDGRLDIFVFMSDRVPNQAGEGEVMLCKAVAMRDGEISGYGCNTEPEAPPPNGIHSASTESGGGSTAFSAGVGESVESVILEFDTGRRWRIVPAGGVVYATWPWGVGTLTRATAIAIDGSFESVDF